MNCSQYPRNDRTMNNNALPSRLDEEQEREAFLKLTDDEMRDQARDLHEMGGVIEIDADAQVMRPTDLGECARIAAWISVGPGDWSPEDGERSIARRERSRIVAQQAEHTT